MVGYTLAVLAFAVVALYIGLVVILDSQLDVMENAFESRTSTRKTS